MRGFRFRSSLKKCPARKVFSRGFAARVCGRRNEALRHTREKTSGTQGKIVTIQTLKANEQCFTGRGLCTGAEDVLK